MMMVIPLAAKTDDFAGAMRGVGIDVNDDPDLFEILEAISGKIEKTRNQEKQRSDLAEMAENALIETLSATIGAAVHHLFETTPSDVQKAFAKLSTKKEFGILNVGFFGKLLGKCLDYVLSRALPEYVGAGKRLPNVADFTTYTGELKTFCEETARIVEQYAGDWYSKECFQQQGEIDKERVFHFTYGAFAKLSKALEKGVS
ncbi:MAG: hypothetical protein ACRC8S_12040 [Fimbriiglobus sp.]